MSNLFRSRNNHIPCEIFLFSIIVLLIKYAGESFVFRTFHRNIFTYELIFEGFGNKRRAYNWLSESTITCLPTNQPIYK